MLHKNGWHWLTEFWGPFVPQFLEPPDAASGFGTGPSFAAEEDSCNFLISCQVGSRSQLGHLGDFGPHRLSLCVSWLDWRGTMTRPSDMGFNHQLGRYWPCFRFLGWSPTRPPRKETREVAPILRVGQELQQWQNQQMQLWQSQSAASEIDSRSDGSELCRKPVEHPAFHRGSSSCPSGNGKCSSCKCENHVLNLPSSLSSKILQTTRVGSAESLFLLVPECY